MATWYDYKIDNRKWRQEMIVGVDNKMKIKDDSRRWLYDMMTWLQKLTIGVDHQNLLITFNTKNQRIKCKILVNFFRI